MIQLVAKAVRARIMRRRLSGLLFRAAETFGGRSNFGTSGSIAFLAACFGSASASSCPNNSEWFAHCPSGHSLFVWTCASCVRPPRATYSAPTQTLLPLLAGFDPTRKKTVLIALIESRTLPLLPINKSSITWIQVEFLPQWPHLRFQEFPPWRSLFSGCVREFMQLLKWKFWFFFVNSNLIDIMVFG